MTAPRKPPSRLGLPDRHGLYEAAVQSVDYDLDHVERLFRRLRGRPARVLREDFCGTAGLACAWALRDPAHVAYGVDLDPDPLAWARAHRLAHMNEGTDRVHLLQGDVLHARVPPADVTLAYNFSYWVFHTRPALLAYFRAAHRGLKRDGLLLLEMFGGTEAMSELVESRRIVGRSGPDGVPIAPFRYVWEQERFDAVTHSLQCAIHFELAGGRTLKRAFRYDWRLWTLPEVRELLHEAGFKDAIVYTQGWDDAANELDGVYRRRASFANQESWLAIVVGVK
jgi:SAM-dependent methyltransferase